MIPRTPSPRWIGVVAAATWLATTAAMQWSVVRFRLLILLVLTAASVVLAVSLARRVVPDPAQRWVPVTLAGSAVVTLAVPLFTYLRDGWLTAAVTVTAAEAAEADEAGADDAIAADPWDDQPAAPATTELSLIHI